MRGREEGTNIFELKKAELAEVGDGAARRVNRNDQVHQLHWLRPKQIHRWPTIHFFFFSIYKIAHQKKKNQQELQ